MGKQNKLEKNKRRLSWLRRFHQAPKKKKKTLFENRVKENLSPSSDSSLGLFTSAMHKSKPE